jgi:hypothetical protein
VLLAALIRLSRSVVSRVGRRGSHSQLPPRNLYYYYARSSAESPFPGFAVTRHCPSQEGSERSEAGAGQMHLHIWFKAARAANRKRKDGREKLISLCGKFTMRCESCVFAHIGDFI